MTTLGRLLVAVLALWFLIGLVAVTFFASGGDTPPARGQGTEIERPR